MNFKIVKMEDKYAKQIASWKYEDKYAKYNTDSFEMLKKRNSGIVNPEKVNNYLCFIDENDKLIAYINIMKREDDTIFLGIGIEPESCGRGLGRSLLKIGIKESKKRYRDSLITLQVRSWNERAIKCYKSSGFKIIEVKTTKDHSGKDAEFVFMEEK